MASFASRGAAAQRQPGKGSDRASEDFLDYGARQSSQTSSRWVRCLRKCRRWIRICLSPRFWHKVMLNQCRRYFGIFVRRWVICGFTLLDVITATLCSTFFLIVPSVVEISRLPFLRNGKVTSLLLFTRAVASCIGLVGAARRKVRTTRVFFYSIPMLVLFAFIAADPVFNMQCWCMDFQQCEVVQGFDPLLRSTYPGVDNRAFGITPNGSRWDRPYLLREENETNSSNKDAAERRVDDLLRAECTCSGEVWFKRHTNTRSGRQSCRYYVNDEGLLKSWCYVRRKSVNACLKVKGPYQGYLYRMYYDHRVNRYWTHDICMDRNNFAPFCQCSSDGMKVDESLGTPARKGLGSKILHDSSRELLGSTCQPWYEGDNAPWCFVGFDSACADRKIYTPKKELVKPFMVEQLARKEGLAPYTRLTQVSQFRSYAACQKDLRRKVQHTCRMVRNTMAVALVALVVFPAPASVIIFLWVKNRCGDLFTFRSEFDVSFSDSEEDDDFMVDSGDEGATAATPSSRRRRKERRQGEPQNYPAGASGVELQTLHTPPAEVLPLPLLPWQSTSADAQPAHPVATPVHPLDESSGPIPVLQPVRWSPSREAPRPRTS